MASNSVQTMEMPMARQMGRSRANRLSERKQDWWQELQCPASSEHGWVRRWGQQTDPSKGWSMGHHLAIHLGTRWSGAW